VKKKEEKKAVEKERTEKVKERTRTRKDIIIR